jgi:hypothetical protein
MRGRYWTNRPPGLHGQQRTGVPHSAQDRPLIPVLVTDVKPIPCSRKLRQRQQPKSPAAVRGQVKQGKQTAENPASLLRISYACGSRAAGLSLVRKGANGPGRHTGLLRLTPTMVDAEIAASGSPASSSDGAAGGAEGRPLVPAAMVRGAACGLAPISLERSGRAAWREPSCARSLHAVSALLRAAGAF